MAMDRKVTEILLAVAEGQDGATEELLPLVYDVLRGIAHQQMDHRHSPQTLQPTALVHEAYLRLFGGDEPSWDSRRHFFAAAAMAMRRILVDRARRRRASKRMAAHERVSLDRVIAEVDGAPLEQVLALDKALKRLEDLDPRAAEVVVLRYFTGLTIDNTARALDISTATVKRDWQFAKTWLRREMTRDERPGA